MKSGRYPTNLKHRFIAGIYKGGDKDLAVNYRPKDLIVSNSHKLRDDTTLNPRQFINEDLTPLRSKLLTYIKTKVPSVISKSVHSREGRILCKKSEDQSKWVYIEDIRDLQKLSVNISDDLLKELALDNCMINIENA